MGTVLRTGFGFKISAGAYVVMLLVPFLGKAPAHKSHSGSSAPRSASSEKISDDTATLIACVFAGVVVGAIAGASLGGEMSAIAGAFAGGIAGVLICGGCLVEREKRNNNPPQNDRKECTE